MVYMYNKIKPLRSLWCQLSRTYHNHQASAPFHTFNSPIRSFDKTLYCYCYPPFFRITNLHFPLNVRFFAAPIQFQVKPKQEVEDSGPRLNDQIKADVVRLVMEEGHFIVSRDEALKRAADDKLDLVEVDRNSKPTVCRIMDYHKEKYKKQEKFKDPVSKHFEEAQLPRLKEKRPGLTNDQYKDLIWKLWKKSPDNPLNQSGVTLRKGDCKEVRLSMKIEGKDLQMKANTVKRLLESGYRVKCMATAKDDKKNKNWKEEDEEAQTRRITKEQEDMKSIVARLSALIEDVSIVESGPILERKQAYVVVRHIKFGPSKKAGSPKKVSKIETNLNTQNPIEDRSADHLNSEIADEAPLEDNKYKMEVSLDNRYKREVSSDNRYKRPESAPVIGNKRPENAPVVDSRYNKPNISMPNENRYNRENNAPSSVNRYDNKVNNLPPSENRYNNRADNTRLSENGYNNRVNNAPPNDNRYNRENISLRTENRYRRDIQYNGIAEGRSGNDLDIRERTQSQGENIYRSENNFDQARHPRPQGGSLTLPYSDNR